jgi:uncharacterized protein YjbI with pentapeptide repeats
MDRSFNISRRRVGHLSPTLLIDERRSVKGWYAGTSIDSQDTLAFASASGVRSMKPVLTLEGAAEAYHADLSGVELRRCNLDHALLSGATLNRADLGGASLWQADLAGACLGEVNFQGAKLDHADLRGADLRGADLGRASVWGAHVEGTDLRETIGLGPEQLSVLRR